jgi:hypothetical protein
MRVHVNSTLEIQYKQRAGNSAENSAKKDLTAAAHRSARMHSDNLAADFANLPAKSHYANFLQGMSARLSYPAAQTQQTVANEREKCQHIGVSMCDTA